jgi:hypothetical protein
MSQTPWQTHWLEMPGLWRCLLQQTSQFVGNLGISIPSEKSSTRSLIPTWTDILIQIHQLPKSCHGFPPQKDPLIEQLQIAAIADYYYLVQNLQPAGSGLDDAGVAVGGLSSDTYGRMTF